MLIDDVTSFEDLAEKIEEEGGIATVRMETLRTLNDSERLGVNVVDTISEKLSEEGIGHQPESLPTDKNRIVLLYQNKTVLAKVLKHLNDIQPDSDVKIRKLTEDNAKEQIAKIRRVLAA